MDAFEEIIAALFEEEGYWILRNYKVNLTTDQKKELENSTMPRPEIDIVAYKPGNNELVFIECKSYLDSMGVQLSAVIPDGSIKLFADEKYRKMVVNEFIKQASEKSLVSGTPTVKYCLVAGNIRSRDHEGLRKYFTDQQWELCDLDWIRERLTRMANKGYENNIAVMMAKLLLR